MRIGVPLILGVCATVLISTALPLGYAFAVVQFGPPTHFSRAQSGLVAFDPLNKTLSKQELLTKSMWFFGGSAPVFNAPYNFYEDSNGLQIGGEGSKPGSWAGYFATAGMRVELAHAMITMPTRTVPNNHFQTGLYVQTSDSSGGASLVDYVTCSALASPSGTVWLVGKATGNASGASSFTNLWVDTSANQPLTRDCQIITNGTNYLEVFLDHRLVYANDSMNLGYRQPLHVFIEIQSSYATKMLYGSFSNFYATTSSLVEVTNLPSGAKSVGLFSPSGSEIAFGPVSSSTAIIPVGQDTFPIQGRIVVYGSNKIELASAPGILGIYGGDVYAYSPFATRQIPSIWHILDPIGSLGVGPLLIAIVGFLIVDACVIFIAPEPSKPVRLLAKNRRLIMLLGTICLLSLTFDLLAYVFI